jgi:mannosyltransferase
VSATDLIRAPSVRRLASETFGTPAQLICLAGLTALGLAVRLVIVDQPAAYDELYLYEAVHSRSLHSSMEVVVETESTPPLYFLVAWVAAKVGSDDFLWIKLPSLVAGTITIPLIYWLGVRTVGRTAGLIGAGFFTLAPFDIFYATEGRGYATLALLSVLSTICLVELVRTGRQRWAVALAFSSAGVLYTHYTGVFVIAAQFGWALVCCRARARPVLLAAAGTVALLLPWASGFLEQRADNTAERLEELPLTFSGFWTTLGKISVGHPMVGLKTVPGIGGLFIAAGVIAAALALLPAVRTNRLRVRRDVALIVLVAVASPVGAFLYSLGPENVYGPRYLSASVPALALATGALLTTPRRSLVVAAATALVLAGLAVGTVRTLQPDTQRPRFDRVAQDLDRSAPADTPIIEASLFYGAPSRQLGFYFTRHHQYFPAGRPIGAAFKRAERAHQLYFLAPTSALRPFVDFYGLRGRGYREVARREYPGAPALTLVRFWGGRQSAASPPGNLSPLPSPVARGSAAGDAPAQDQRRVVRVKRADGACGPRLGSAVAEGARGPIQEDPRIAVIRFVCHCPLGERERLAAAPDAREQ